MIRSFTRASAASLYLLLTLAMEACDRYHDPQQRTDTHSTITINALPPPAVSTKISSTMPQPTLTPTSVYLIAQNSSCAQDSNMRAIAALDDLTVRFDLCTPDAAFPAKAALPVFGIQPRSWIEAHSSTGEILVHPISTGPWQLNEWLHGQALHFTRFEGYWREPAPFRELIFRWESDAETRLEALRSGTVDAITNLRSTDYQTVQQDEDLTFIPVQSTNTLYLGMNNIFSPFDDKRVRQAIALGIDRHAIVAGTYPAGSEVATHFTPCSIPNGCSGDEWPQFDLPNARALLSTAGYPHGFQSALYYQDVYRLYLPEPGQVADELQHQLRTNLSIEVTIILTDSASLISQATDGELDGFHLLGWGADYAHISSFLNFHFGQHGQQFGSPHPQLQQLVVQAAGVTDVTKAIALYSRTNNIISRLVPAIPIAHGTSAYAARTGITNLRVPPFGAPQFYLSDPGTDRFVFMQNAEPLSLYCADETDLESMAACQQVVEGLFGYAHGSAKIEPRLAEGCKPNTTASQWICRLRPNVSFHDGSPLHANDVVASWAAALDASNPHHTGNTGSFIYPQWLWGDLMNNPTR